MRKLLLPIALAGLAGLTGCVGYGGGVGVGYGTGYYDNGYGYGYGNPGYSSSPYYGYSGGVVIQSGPSRYYGGRDRDGDGVPNRYDSRPNNPRRN